MSHGRPARTRSLPAALGVAVAIGVTAGAVAAAATTAPADTEGRVEKTLAGVMPDGTEVHRYTLSNAGLRARILTYGATLIAVETPDRDGKLANITLHLDTFEDYRRGHPLFGSIVGRFANRIAGARFTIDGVEHELTPNAGENHIHGGRTGFQKVVWSATPIRDARRVGVRLEYTSADGEEGYPGRLDVVVTYALTDSSELRIEYRATTDRPTHLNLTNHAYWNLSGAGSGDVLRHELTLAADEYLKVDAQKIPSGELVKVAGGVMDFTEPRAIGSRIERVDDQNYDHCYVLRGPSGEKPRFAARVLDPASGRFMEVFTTEPGVQLYTAKHLNGRYRAGGAAYGPYHGLCLEMQHYPDAPNHPEFPSTLLRPGAVYRQVTVHRFGVRE